MIGGNITITGNLNLYDIFLGNWSPTSGNTDSFANNNLSSDTVNALLASYVMNGSYLAGSIDLSGGTNATPTNQGATDYCTLQGRGVTVTINGSIGCP
jgi:hypothetical protein